MSTLSNKYFLSKVVKLYISMQINFNFKIMQQLHVSQP